MSQTEVKRLFIRRSMSQIRKVASLSAEPLRRTPWIGRSQDCPTNLPEKGAGNAPGVYLACVSGPSTWAERAGLGALWAHVSGTSGPFRKVFLTAF